MASFIQELSEKNVLSVDDITLLKKYIAEKYGEYSSKRKSEILVNAVHQVLDKNIPDIKKEYKQVLKQDLLKETIFNDGKPLNLAHIFHACISIPEKPSEFSNSITNWVNFHVENKISNNDLKIYEVEETIIQDEVENYSSQELYEPSEEMQIDVSAKEEVEAQVLDRSTKVSRIIKYGICTLMILIAILSGQYIIRHSLYPPVDSTIHNIEFDIKSYKLLNDDLPFYFKYRDIKKPALKHYLKGRKSLLAEEPYFSTIISVAKKYDLNPLILFAIAGQEQGFVSKEGDSYKKIANNPFNVYHSWKEYNTNIEDASRIVCRTIINLSKGRPYYEEPFRWLNRSYAEDKNWSSSVLLIYKSLEKNDYSSK